MERRWWGNDPLRLALLKAELESKGIRFMVKNEALGIAAAELPPQETWPEVWIADDERFADALDVLQHIAKDEGASRRRGFAVSA